MNSSRFGSKTLISGLISLLILGVSYLAIKPRFSDGRLRLNEDLVLTAAEVRLLPDQVLPVVLGRDLGETDRDFRSQLLQLVMDRSGVPHSFGLAAEEIPQDAEIDALSSGDLGEGANPLAVTVGVFGAGPALNQRLRPIPIPISGGVLGLRVGWMHASRLMVLNGVQNLDGLRRITLVQGNGWSEIAIFDASALSTYGANPTDLFRLIKNQRVDLFPRGLAELQSEMSVARRNSSSIMLDPHLLIAYPFAGFFYVNPSNEALAEAIRIGFERAIADGSYQKLLNASVFTPWLRENLDLRERRVIFLPNPNAAASLEQVKPQHWLIPWEDLSDGRITMGSQLCDVPGLKALC